MARLLHQLDDAAGQPKLPLNRLVAVRRRADAEQAGPVTACAQFAAQHLGNVAFGDDPRFKIQTGRQTKIAVRRARVTVAAAVFAAPVRVDRPIKVDIGQVIAGDDRTHVFQRDLRLRWRHGAVGKRAIGPAVAKRLTRVARKTVGNGGGGAATLDCVDRQGEFGHGAIWLYFYTDKSAGMDPGSSPG